MKRTHPRQVITALLGATLLIAALVPAASAAPPAGWRITVENLAPVVKSGNDAGFKVTVENVGPSNIPVLYLTSNQTVAPSFISTNPWCNTSGALFCSFGALNAGAPALVIQVIAYSVPEGVAKFPVVFQLNTNGKTFSDKGNNSRGDTLDGNPVPALTINNNANFGGGFVVDDTTVSNSSSLGNRNIQTTTVIAPATLIPATVEDGITTDLCASGSCTAGTQFGEWSKVSVNNNFVYGSAFRVDITILGRALPSPKPDADEVFVYHTNAAGTPTIIGDTAAERCASAAAPGTVPADGCVFADYNGQNLVITIWGFHNGGYKGAY